MVKRIIDNYTEWNVPEELQKRVWELYDEGYGYGIISDSNDIDITWDGETTIINMRQNDPYRVKIIKDEADYGIKEDIYLNIYRSSFKEVEMMTAQDWQAWLDSLGN